MIKFLKVPDSSCSFLISSGFSIISNREAHKNLHIASQYLFKLTFTEDGVYGRTVNLGVDSLNGLLLCVLDVGWIVGYVVSLGLELGNAFEQLVDGGGDVRKLDEVSLGSLEIQEFFDRVSVYWRY